MRLCVAVCCKRRLERPQAYHKDFVASDSSLLWISVDGGSLKYSQNDLASLSVDLKEMLRKNTSRKICIVLDVIPSMLMVNQTESVYRFLDQLLSEIRNHNAILLATFEEGIVQSTGNYCNGAVIRWCSPSKSFTWEKWYG